MFAAGNKEHACTLLHVLRFRSCKTLHVFEPTVWVNGYMQQVNTDTVVNTAPRQLTYLDKDSLPTKDNVNLFHRMFPSLC